MTPHIPSHQLTERWFLVNADGQIVGKMATTIAKLLMGKDQPQFNPAVDARTNVVVINAEKIKFSGKKLEDKKYYHHSGYPGGTKVKTPQDVLGSSSPARVLIHAVTGMLPKNKLRQVMLKRLKVFVGDKHPHTGQNPVELKIKN
ncbi:50S ribosomal protein L13 [candidate division Kazan bacterium]|uniref:Large ribosomal subunit protein uL13 n=1 Tax=candidate division Kazan bacterium TaxID=2202143 RepID=A0A420ZDS7_UNCK3|nr:MAG: 50S ribosomal protein L13 [candidate division Kazan bacterium]